MSVILKVKKSLHPTIQYTCSSSWGKQMLHNLYCVRTFRGFLDTILNITKCRAGRSRKTIRATPRYWRKAENRRQAR